ncbi:hypothetical protein [Fodinibius sp. SL11]|uniref:hypothetical protein n=1 Tax=Fodinibius sp. SL11 TaxID=3425690 RepID=UPI003F881175
MKNSKNIFFSMIRSGITMLMLFFIASACSEQSGTSTDSLSEVKDLTQAKFVAQGGPNVVDITSQHNHDTNEHLFQVSEEEIPTGWTTFRFNNRTHSDHFYLLYKVPDAAIQAANSVGEPVLDHWYNTVTVPFQQQWNPYIEGDIDFGTFVNNLFGAVLSSAPWFVEAVTMGGPGLTAAGQTSQTTVKLLAGTYIAECYVKDENQEFHSYNGMLDVIKVTDEASGEKEPRATMEVTVTQNGIDHEESVRPGMHTVAIHFGAQPATGYGHLLGHNVQLVRFDEGYDQELLDELGAWMNWTTEEGLVDRAPAGATFLGGSMEMTGGNTAYYQVNLKPGSYAWIAEVPDPASKGMLKTFSIPFGR